MSHEANLPNSFFLKHFNNSQSPQPNERQQSAVQNPQKTNVIHNTELAKFSGTTTAFHHACYPAAICDRIMPATQSVEQVCSNAERGNKKHGFLPIPSLLSSTPFNETSP